MLELAERPPDAIGAAPRGVATRNHIDRVLFARHAAGDAGARDELIERFLPLAHAVARRYERPGEPLDDLFQVASLALVKAVDRFDAARGHAFTSFAVPTIVGEIKRHFRDRTWEVRPPRRLLELTLRVEKAAGEIALQRGSAATVAELARATGAPEELVLEALQAHAGRNRISLQAPVGMRDHEQQLQDTIGVSDAGYARAEDRALVDGLLGYLSARERDVVRLRFERDLTQAEIGAMLQISQMQVSRILRESLDRLRVVVEQQRKLSVGSGAGAGPAPR